MSFKNNVATTKTSTTTTTKSILLFVKKGNMITILLLLYIVVDRSYHPPTTTTITSTTMFLNHSIEDCHNVINNSNHNTKNSIIDDAETATTTTSRPEFVRTITEGKNDNTDDPHHLLRLSHVYEPSILEQYVIDHANEIGLTVPTVNRYSPESSCNFITNATDSNIQQHIQTYLSLLQQYNTNHQQQSMQQKQQQTKTIDLRKLLRNDTNENVCSTLFGSIQLGEIFSVNNDNDNNNNNNNRNYLSKSSWNGYIEPLLPPLRHPQWCTKRLRTNLFRLDYIIHDFYTMCMNLRPYSQIIIIDIGASLQFHSAGEAPILSLIHVMEQNGFHIDHIYAYEMTQQNTTSVYTKLPSHLHPAYHWINVGVSADTTSLYNPLRTILPKYEPHDLILIKLDIDTPTIEIELMKQLLIMNSTSNINNVVDHVYFEHHVQLREMKQYWRDKVDNMTVHESMKLFQQLRSNGIAAHYWV